MIQLKKIFEDILDNTYPDSEKLEWYKKVYVQVIDETRKSFHGDYNTRDRSIRIFNLHRSDASLVATSIHELTHHVDYCNRRTTDHSKAFYDVFEELLFTALNMGIFSKEEFIESTRDASDSNKICAMLERYKAHPIAYKSDMVVLSVDGGYNRFKESGYKWNNGLKTWEKEVHKNDIEKEKEFLDELRFSYMTRSAGKFSMSHGSQIMAGKGSYEIRDILKKEGFSYQSKLRVWSKSGTKEEMQSYKSKYPAVEWTIQ